MYKGIKIYIFTIKVRKRMNIRGGEFKPVA
jgi:hypothetical protein